MGIFFSVFSSVNPNFLIESSVCRQIIGNSIKGGLQSLLACIPIGGADLAMLLKELKGIDDAQCFLDAPAEWEIIDKLMADDPLAINQEDRTVGHHLAGSGEIPFVIKTELPVQHAIGGGDCLIGIGQKRIFHSLNPTLLFGSLEPCPMGLGRVGRAADQRDIALIKLVEFLLESMQFRWADKGEILRVEEEHDILPIVKLIERVVLDRKAVNDGACIEVWG